MIVQALTMKLKNPKVSKLKGKVISSKMGLNIRFTSSNTTPIINRAGILLITIVGDTSDSRYIVNTIDIYFIDSFDMLPPSK
jgi:hypothetical protein